MSVRGYLKCSGHFVIVLLTSNIFFCWQPHCCISSYFFFIICLLCVTNFPFFLLSFFLPFVPSFTSTLLRLGKDLITNLVYMWTNISSCQCEGGDIRLKKIAFKFNAYTFSSLHVCLSTLPNLFVWSSIGHKTFRRVSNVPQNLAIKGKLHVSQNTRKCI